jgi:hypothetical protein
MRDRTSAKCAPRQAPDLLAGHWALISGLGAVPRALVWDNESAVGQWHNVVFLGPPGTGKTHLSTGLGIRACQAGDRVAFATAAQWVARLADAHHAGTLQAELITEPRRMRAGLGQAVPVWRRPAHLNCGRPGYHEITGRATIAVAAFQP